MPYSVLNVIKKVIVFFLFFGILLQFNLPKIFAQDDSLGIAVYLSIAAKDVPNGSVIAFSDKGYILNSTPYNPLVVGISATKPAVVLGEKSDNTYPVVSTGNTYMRVSGEGGKISVGDLITGSSTPGLGMKATHDGYVLASALEDFTPSSKTDSGVIAVSMNIHYYTSSVKLQNNLFDIFSIGASATYQQPTTVFKYIVAGVVVVLSFIFGFYLFGRTANKGIDALGRNPLAARMIQLGIIFNVAITIAVIASGIIVAYLVLRL